jgi:1-acyl-sn-glycerol-3-phosphate acyltransferase
MMPQVRSTLLNLAIYFYTMVFSLIGCFVLFMPTKIIIHYSIWWMDVVLMLTKSIGGLGWNVMGQENLPKEGNFIIASKHQSMMETILIPYFFRYAVPILKKELVQIPLWGALLKNYGAIGIDRSSKTKAIRQIQKQASLYKNRNFFIFPEGTRSPVGVEGEYQSGVYMLYRLLNYPIVPIALNTGFFWPRRGWTKYPGTATLKILQPIEPGLPKEEFMATLKNMIETESAKLIP